MIRNTRYALAPFAVAALVVLGTGGVVAATGANGPTAAPPSASPSETVQPADYAVDVVDPDDELGDAAVEAAWQTAWANDSVRSHFDAAESVHFQVWAPTHDDGDVSVWVAVNETAPTRVVADVDIETGSVTDVRESEVRTADRAVELDFDGSVEESDDGVYKVELEDDAGDGNVTRLSVEDHDSLDDERNESVQFAGTAGEGDP